MTRRSIGAAAKHRVIKAERGRVGFSDTIDSLASKRLRRLRRSVGFTRLVGGVLLGVDKSSRRELFHLYNESSEQAESQSGDGDPDCPSLYMFLAFPSVLFKSGSTTTIKSSMRSRRRSCSCFQPKLSRRVRSGIQGEALQPRFRHSHDSMARHFQPAPRIPHPGRGWCVIARPHADPPLTYFRRETILRDKKGSKGSRSMPILWAA